LGLSRCSWSEKTTIADHKSVQIGGDGQQPVEKRRETAGCEARSDRDLSDGWATERAPRNEVDGCRSSFLTGG